MATRFRAAIDGGSRGNPGPAAWGVAVLDDHDECIEGFGSFPIRHVRREQNKQADRLVNTALDQAAAVPGGS